MSAAVTEFWLHVQWSEPRPSFMPGLRSPILARKSVSAPGASQGSEEQTRSQLGGALPTKEPH